MSRNTWWGKTLRTIGILLMGITALFTLASGVGTTCVALNPTGFGDKMAPIAPFQWLYILFVVVTTAIGILAARAVVLLAKGRSDSYRSAILAMVMGIAVGVIHMLVSRALRGSSMPVDGVVYTTALTLVVFLLFRLPGVREGVGFNSGGPGDGTGRAAASLTLLVTGTLTLTISIWAGPSHTWEGTNWAGTFQVTTLLAGLLQLATGMALAIPGRVLRREAFRQDGQPATLRPRRRSRA